MRLPVQDLMNMYKNNVYAAAFSICKNASDAEDVVQDTFLQYYMTHINFDNEQHIRAWLLRVAINKAKIFSPLSGAEMECLWMILLRHYPLKHQKLRNYLKRL